jgi:pimeloyl-ACP methyl ester carboxylesterase
LDTHVIDVTQVLEYENFNEVIIVGHSYVGLVIDGVAEKVPDRIRHLVYLDAYIPQDNKSAFDIVFGSEITYKQRALKEQGMELLVASYTLEESGLANSVYINWMSTRLFPIPWHTHDQAIRITTLQAKNLLKAKPLL